MHRMRSTATGRPGRWPEGLVILEGQPCWSLWIQVSPIHAQLDHLRFVLLVPIVNDHRRYVYLYLGLWIPQRPIQITQK